MEGPRGEVVLAGIRNVGRSVRVADVSCWRSKLSNLSKLSNWWGVWGGGTSETPRERGPHNQRYHPGGLPTPDNYPSAAPPPLLSGLATIRATIPYEGRSLDPTLGMGAP